MYSRWNPFALTVLMLFTAVPLAAGIGYAFLYSFGVIGALNKGFITDHWKRLFDEGAVWKSFGYSAIIAAVTVLTSVAVAMWVALRKYNNLKKGWLSYFIYLPLSFPAMVAGFFAFQALSGAGLLSRIFYKIGITSSIESFPSLINDYWGIGILLAQCFLCLPFFLLLYVNRIQTERIPEYLDLAGTLGASRSKAMWKIAAPILWQKTTPNILIYFIFIFGSYEIPVLLGRSNPEMVSVLAVRKLQKFNLYDIPQGYAVALIYTAFVLLIIALIFKKRRLANDL